jgi:hypothetical protein
MLLIAVTIAVPLICAMVCYGQYMSNSIHILSVQAKIEDRESKIQARAKTVRDRAELEKKAAVLQDCLGDISQQIARNEQWSDVLRLVVENLPGSMVLSNIEVKVDNQAKNVNDPVDPNKVKQVNFITRQLLISILGSPKSDTINMVREYIRLLGSDSKLSSRLEDIRITGQEIDKLGQTDMMKYNIQCVYKTISE